MIQRCDNAYVDARLRIGVKHRLNRAKVERTQVVRSRMLGLLLELWPEKHPAGQEQTLLDLGTQNRQRCKAVSR